MSHSSLRNGALLALFAFSAGLADAALIQTSQILPSTSLGQYLSFSINQINDGITSDGPSYNGYASGIGAVSGRITFTLNQSYDLDSFVLWNDINVLNEGVRTFTLTFENASAVSLGTTPTLPSVSQFAPQTYNFAATVLGVKKVHMDVLTSNLQIEIREIAFNGQLASIPEPAGAGLAVAALAGCLAWARRRRTRSSR